MRGRLHLVTLALKKRFLIPLLKDEQLKRDSEKIRDISDFGSHMFLTANYLKMI